MTANRGVYFDFLLTLDNLIMANALYNNIKNRFKITKILQS